MLKKIEQNLGVKLFDRTTTAVTLTQAGEAYVEVAQKIMGLETNLAVYLEELENLNTGSLVLAGTDFFCSYVIPPVITRYQQHYPKISLELIESDSLLLYDMADADNLDLIVDAGQYDRQRFETRKLFEEHILLAVPKGRLRTRRQRQRGLTEEEVCHGRHLEQGGPQMPIRDFVSEPFLLLKREHDLYNKAVGICQEQGVEPKSFLHLNQLMTAYSLVCQGLGLAFVSDTLVRFSRTSAPVRYFKLAVKDSQLTRRDVFVAYRKNRYITRAMRGFIQLAEELYQSPSLRLFAEELPSETVLRQVIQAGRYAPRGGNRQKIRYIILQRRLEEFRALVVSGFEEMLNAGTRTVSSSTATLCFCWWGRKFRLFWGWKRGSGCSTPW